MKLTGISINDYGICRNLKISQIGDGLNIIYGRNGSGKSTLLRFIRNSLYGFPLNDTRYRGSVDISKNGLPVQLNRDNHQPTATTEFDTGPLIDEAIFDAALMVDGRRLADQADTLSRLLRYDFSVPQGPNALGNQSLHQNVKQTIVSLQTKLERLVARINDLENRRDQYLSQIEIDENRHQSHRRELENQIRQLTDRIEQIELTGLQRKIESIDREIADLRSKIDSIRDQIQYVSQPYRPSDGLTILYRRLDDIDNQIRRWRAVHKDVQDQRVRLKDEMVVWNEMTMESTSHPYHRSRKLLGDIESGLVSAENSLNQSKDRLADNSQHFVEVAGQVAELCARMRKDLYCLCDELGAQYKSVRHRTAAAELKRLRRCYHEIGDNIESLAEHRRVLIEEIRQLDPNGAAAIIRADQDFCSCAQHEGYLHARRTYIGEIEQHPRPTDVIKTDHLSEQKARLAQLEHQRSECVRDLVQMENELSTWRAQRKDLTSQLERMRGSIDLSGVQAKLDDVQAELIGLLEERESVAKELAWNQSITPEPANPILVSVSRWVSGLTAGEIQKVWVCDQNECEFEIENRQRVQYSFNQLGSGLQQQVVLGICLAIADQQRQTQHFQPMLLDDVFVNLDPELIDATFHTLLKFSEQGNQVIALTSDQTVTKLAIANRVRRFDLPSGDLPDTAVSPAPIWTPQRDFSEPLRTDNFDSQAVAIASHHLRSDYGKTGDITYQPLNIANSQSRFPRPSLTPRDTVWHPNGISENSSIESLGIDLDSLNQFKRIGVTQIDDLLQLDPGEDWESDDINADAIDHYQSLAWLLICVPALEVGDAEMLISLGINEPEQLENTHAQQLLDRISRSVDQGNRIYSRSSGYQKQDIDQWYESLNQTRSRWRLPSGYSRRQRWRSRNRGEASRLRLDRSWRERMESNSQRKSSSTRSRRNRSTTERTGFEQRSLTKRTSRQVDADESRSRNASKIESAPAQSVANNSSGKSMKSQPKTKSGEELKFYLSQSDDLEAAPSIGPKTAERFIKVGVVTVGDFLKQTSEKMASDINYKRISAEVIRQWQHQARLVCRVPNLRGHDAQLLVAVGITDPEELANQAPEKLFSIVQPFAESKEGLKIIRAGKQPDLDEIRDWIEWAQHTRSLKAA